MRDSFSRPTNRQIIQSDPYWRHAQLASKARAQILHLLCEGQSIRSITRVMGVSKNTVAKLLSDAGAVCAEYQDRVLVNLTSRRIQVDEIWSFTYAKQMNVARAKRRL